MRLDVRLGAEAAKRARYVAKALARSQADCVRFLIDKEYRELLGFAERAKMAEQNVAEAVRRVTLIQEK
jgi:predicted DNA-binding protein